MQIELRTFNPASPKLDGNTLTGIVIPYNSDSRGLGFTERFLPGSVSETIKSGVIEAWQYHERTMPLGSQHGGTLKLTDSPTSLNYSIDLPDTSYARDLKAMMAGDRKDIGGASFGFRPSGPEGERWTRKSGTTVREIVKADIEHISPVVSPAYQATTALLRGLNVSTEKDAQDLYGFDVETLLRAFVTIKKGFALEDAETEIVRRAVKVLREAIPKPRLNKAKDRAESLLL
jgi:HK97 family phage prohead protease